MVDVKKALLNPSAVFHRPQEVVQNKELSREQKIEILRRWEYDSRELQVADEESMTAPQAEGGDTGYNSQRTARVECCGGRGAFRADQTRRQLKTGRYRMQRFVRQSLPEVLR